MHYAPTRLIHACLGVDHIPPLYTDSVPYVSLPAGGSVTQGFATCCCAVRLSTTAAGCRLQV
jgi:hypothetical protein